MALKLESLAANREKENDGDWVVIPDLGGAVSLKVRSLHFAPFVAARAVAQRRFNMRYKDGNIPEDELNSRLGALAAEHLLIDWTGFDKKYSPEIAASTLSDPAYRDLVGHVLWAAMQVGAAKAEFIEDASKNSATPSAGN